MSKIIFSGSLKRNVKTCVGWATCCPRVTDESISGSLKNNIKTRGQQSCPPYALIVQTTFYAVYV
ncbi:MAG: hypothetical protein IKX14_04720 [Neisseriaceae bacterium]|nr:hypothetical protein [Neisseriaceae bacterium]